MSPVSSPPIRIALLLILALAAVLALRDIGNPHLGTADANRILMDGVFMHDFLSDLPLTDIYDYTVHYYAQYPALSIGYRPPLLPFFEGLANGLFGINQWSSRLALTGFWLLGVLA